MHDTDVTTHDLKVIIADPDPLARSALAEMVREEPRFVVAAQIGTAVEAAELTTYYAPDVVLIDAALLRDDDFETVRRIHGQRPDVGVVMIATECDEALSMDALRAGVSGIVTKDTPAESIRAALAAVGDGQAILAPETAMALIGRLRQTPAPGRGFRPIRSTLTNREWEILDLLMGDATTRAIADELFVSEDTVYSHVKNILRKLGATSRAEAVETARRLYDLAAAA